MNAFLLLACHTPVTPVTPISPVTPPEPAVPAYEWPTDAVALPGVIAVDADGSRPVTIVLVGGIVDALLSSDVVIPETVVRLDVAGAWVTPGLVDPHVHLLQESTPSPAGDALASNLTASLAYGVTTTADLGDPWTILALRDRIAAGDVLGPDLLATGPFVTAAKSHPCEVFADPTSCTFAASAAEGTAAGEERVVRGADGLKVALTAGVEPDGARIGFEAASAAIARFREGGGLVFVHADTEAEAVEALDAGATILAHPVFLGPLSAEGAADVAGRAAAVHTTIGAFAGAGWLYDGTLADPLLAAPVEAAWDEYRANPEWLDTFVADSDGWAAQARDSLATLDAAGARIVPASDGGYWFVPVGWGFHQELRELEALGWTPLRVLTAATYDGAESLGLHDRGRIAVGQRADLLVLDADPLQDLDALRAPRIVVRAGVPWTRDALLSTDVLVRALSGAEGDFCVDRRDCAPDLECDLTDHLCATDCAVPYDRAACVDADAWCGPVDGLSTTDAVCHTVGQTCDLYEPACEPASYEDACVPADLNTAYCYPSGPQVVGDRCSYADTSQMCRSGLYCSWIDYTCYALCDPDAVVMGCPAGTTCRWQYAADEPWFGLCL